MDASDRIGALPPEMLDYYATGRELDRLARGIGPLELARTKELVARYLPAAPAVVFDVGGGPGIYACWLARQGYEVHLVDAMPLHIEQARQASAAQPDAPVATLEVGDARHIDWPDGCADAVMLHGPLYHLTERAQRMAAIRESARLLRPGGLLLAFAITLYASTLAGLVNWWIHDPGYFEMCRRELAEGLHLQPPDWPGLFTMAYFHRPGELEAELAEAGLAHEATLAVQGPGWLVPGFEEKWQDGGNRDAILRLVRFMETDPVALGISPHHMAVVRTPG
ncbi:MAG: methyltransferase domain-containing protein [Anaerolineae bacterium]|jgi:SAM-dependent methyltransferase